MDGTSDDTYHYGMAVFFRLTCSIIIDLTGIDLARLADLPLSVLVEGRRIAERLSALQAGDEELSESRRIAIRRKVLLRVLRI